MLNDSTIVTDTQILYWSKLVNRERALCEMFNLSNQEFVEDKQTNIKHSD